MMTKVAIQNTRQEQGLFLIARRSAAPQAPAVCITCATINADDCLDYSCEDLKKKIGELGRNFGVIR
jgi:hypothetical protein